MNGIMILMAMHLFFSFDLRREQDINKYLDNCIMRTKICIIATHGGSLRNFRGELIKSWIRKNCEVICVSIESPDKMADEVEKLGARYFQVEGDRTGINVFSGIKMIYNYKKLFDIEQPDVCYLYMSKPVAYGGLAAIIAGVKHINVLVNGLENAYYGATIKDLLIRVVMSCFYKYVCKYADNVFFQNKDDKNYFLKHRLVDSRKTVLIGGSGVDMDHFKKTDLPESPVFLMVARLLWSKGIREYLNAVKKLKKKYPKMRALLVGGLDNNDEALTEDDLNYYLEKGIIEYCGYTDDVRPFISQSSVFVLPSYHEGLPRSVIEAMSMGRAIITTNAPGCKETVEDNYNGFLVPIKDENELAKKMEVFIKNPSLIKKMGEQSYKLCKEKFEISKVNKKINYYIWRNLNNE